MIRSIRWRVAVTTTLGVLLVGGGAAAAWYSLASDILSSELDDELDSKVKTLATLTRCVGDALELEFSDELMPDFLPGKEPSYFQVWQRDGAIVERSRSLGERTLMFPSTSREEVAHWDLVLPDGRPGRAAALAFAVTEGDDVDAEDDPANSAVPPVLPVAVIMAAKSRIPLDSRLASLRLSVALVGLGLAAGLAFVVGHLVGRGLRPLHRLSQEVGALDPRAGPGALPLNGLPTELFPIAHRIDDLLARMHAALERERRVTANIAHELRTPVSELQSLTEVAIRWPKDEQHLRRSLVSAHAVARRMNSLTEAILRLSNPEEARLTIESERFDLSELTRELLTESEGKVRPIEADLAEGVSITSDKVALRIILANLIDNAREHASEGPIVCRLARDDDVAEFCISNPAEDLDEDDVACLGERFWRNDATRTSGDRPHFGLGLTIASELCARIGAELSHRLVSGRLEVRVRMPANEST
ncbi:MAG: HAMP domain-containing histidine kinase [Planctomycetes bacterium]|nr:HAMP domain-containing histidine kinase [Planctomycetota bacterium]